MWVALEWPTFAPLFIALQTRIDCRSKHWRTKKTRTYGRSRRVRGNEPSINAPGAGLQGTGNSGRGLVWQLCREKISLFGEGQLQDGEMFALDWIYRRAQAHWAGAGSIFRRKPLAFAADAVSYGI
jgi:hypothetical protein